MKKFSAECMVMGERNINGHYYPPHVVKKMVVDHKDTTEFSFGTISDVTTPMLDICKISHKITSVDLVPHNNCVAVTGETFLIQNGENLGGRVEGFHHGGMDMYINPVIMTTLRDDPEIDGKVLGEDSKIIRFDISIGPSSERNLIKFED